MKKIKRTKQEMDRMVEFNFNNTYKCSCGHSVVIYPTRTRKLCTWCKHYVYRDKKDEFKDKFKTELRKESFKNE